MGGGGVLHEGVQHPPAILVIKVSIVYAIAVPVDDNSTALLSGFGLVQTQNWYFGALLMFWI